MERKWKEGGAELQVKIWDERPSLRDVEGEVISKTTAITTSKGAWRTWQRRPDSSRWFLINQVISTEIRWCFDVGERGISKICPLMISHRGLSGKAPQATAILEAMKEYGIIISDNGMPSGLIGTPFVKDEDFDLLQTDSTGERPQPFKSGALRSPSEHFSNSPELNSVRYAAESSHRSTPGSLCRCFAVELRRVDDKPFMVSFAYLVDPVVGLQKESEPASLHLFHSSLYGHG
jgi:hypothetical protein